MKTYKVVIVKSAQKEVRTFPKKDQKRIADAMSALQFDPFLGKPLLGEQKGKWTLRVWPYRIIYIIEHQTITVTVLRIGHRQGVYKK